MVTYFLSLLALCGIPCNPVSAPTRLLNSDDLDADTRPLPSAPAVPALLITFAIIVVSVPVLCSICAVNGSAPSTPAVDPFLLICGGV